jgi:hypothetical protein
VGLAKWYLIPDFKLREHNMKSGKYTIPKVKGMRELLGILHGLDNISRYQPAKPIT